MSYKCRNCGEYNIVMNDRIRDGLPYSEKSGLIGDDSVYEGGSPRGFHGEYKDLCGGRLF